jgi:hypothetical protein
MDGTPKRSTSETLGQLVVIAILIAILIGAVLFLRSFVNAHNSSAPAPAPAPTSFKATYEYSCCSAKVMDTIYHPGDVIHLTWTPTHVQPLQAYPKATVELSAQLSGSFSSVVALKSSAKPAATKVKSNNDSAVAKTIWVSNHSGADPVSTITIPRNAKPGYFNLNTTTSETGMTITAGGVIRISK